MKEVKWGEAVVPGVIVAYLIAYVAQTYHMPFRSILYPFILIGLMVVLLVVFAMQQLRASTPSSVEGAVSPAATDAAVGVAGFLRGQGKAIGVIVLTFLFPLVVVHLGLFATVAIYLAFLFWIFGTMKPVFIVPTALVLAFALTWLLLDIVVLNFPRFPYAELPWYF